MKKNNKTNQQNKNYKSRDIVVESLQIPKDIIYGEALINAVGNRECTIENFKGICEYTREKIVIQAKHYKISVQGKNLNIDYYTNESMKIKGRIICVEYLY